MSNYFCINKSGIKIPVYSDTNKTTQIGSIYDREAYGYNANWGGDGYFCNIAFRRADGKISGGFIIDPPNGSMTDCTDYPYGTDKIGGITYNTFLMRNSRNVYKTDGTLWGSVAANRRVACLTAMSGDSNPHWKGINYVENSSGQWIPVTGNGSNYGFVDTGLEIASGYKSIPMYGSW